ncbi:DUF2254 domain-containing protein [Parvularcula sp. ZS-1/3]|uniref:DUF2254 domain-containing protein n=1 Tax=Parvularcula mediterranea TaxID=2732508 RepID=A0A7Y3W624_9PROT|nr:DUF2254 domain-containing protein [Parvularcula mediterranea]NNU17244.1 DUF2254 domain-containing protein [Parvularcula mediterranea]
MDNRFITLLRTVRASYWFVPSVMVLGAFILAAATFWLDTQVSADAIREIGFLAVREPDGARAILSAIAGSLISVVGITFSITIAAVSFASGNYGPRIIGNFMRDRGNQVTLGIFVGTFVYSLLILGTVRDVTGDTDLEPFVPYYSILTTLFLTISAIGMLIYFFHHIPASINIQNLTTSLGQKLRASVSEIFPNDYTGSSDDLPDDPPDWPKVIASRTRTSVTLNDCGYIRSIDIARLEKCALDHDAYIELQYRPGEFVTEEDEVFDLYTNDQEVAEKLVTTVCKSVTVGGQKTFDQNILFLVDTLNEIGIRALSPGVNDPQTAIACMDWMRAAANSFGDRPLETTSDPVRVKVEPLRFYDFIDRAFGSVRPYAAGDRNAALHLVMVLTEIADDLPQGKRRTQVTEELDRFIAEVKALNPNTPWRDEVVRRYDEAQTLLSSKKARRRLRNSRAWFGGKA